METGSPAKGRFKLYEKLELQEFQEKFVIKSMESPSHGFSIDRHDGNIEPLDDGTLYCLFIFLVNSSKLYSELLRPRCFINLTD